MEPVTLRTSRLELSTPAEADIDAITAAVQDPEIAKWTTVPSPYARTDAESFVRNARTRWTSDRECTWAIREDGRVVGMIGLFRHGEDVAEIGYWMAADARGRGLLGEAARAVVDWGFGTLGVARIEWRASVGNVPSARVAQRLGFRYEGTLRQALSNTFGRTDGWIAGLLPTDDRTPVDWFVLDS